MVTSWSYHTKHITNDRRLYLNKQQ